MNGTITCANCGTQSPRRGPVQKYCEPCSTEKQRARQLKWANDHHPETYARNRSRIKERSRATRARTRAVGMKHSRAQGIAWDSGRPIELKWLVRVGVPFSYSLSKNATFRTSHLGHVALRRMTRAAQSVLAKELREAMEGRTTVQNKLWIDILVQKPNHRGDGVNVVDIVCDAIKAAIPLDDRWYCIRRLDWEISKNNPMLFVGIGQEEVPNVSICSMCGRIQTLDAFPKRRHGRLGVDRICRECKKGSRARPANPRAEVTVTPLEPQLFVAEQSLK